MTRIWKLNNLVRKVSFINRLMQFFSLRIAIKSTLMSNMQKNITIQLTGNSFGFNSTIPYGLV